MQHFGTHRKANVTLVEWMPIRQVEMDDNLRIWRSFKLGNLADLIMLDTRQYDRSITDLYWNTDYVHAISQDAGRSLMGSRQENWFYNQLSSSSKRGATWRIIGSQIVFSRVNQSIAFGDESPLNNDAWDGVSRFQNPLNLQFDDIRTGSLFSYLSRVRKLTPTTAVPIKPEQDIQPPVPKRNWKCHLPCWRL